MNRFNQQWSRDDEDDEDEGPDGDDDFDYDEFVENEFGDKQKQSIYSPLIRFTAILLLSIFVLTALLQFLGR
jgi:hypothetical protein